MKNSIGSVFILLVAAVIWGFAFVAQLVGGQSIGAYWLNGIRFIIGGITLMPVICIFEKKSGRLSVKTTVFAAVCAGLILAFATITQNIGILLTNSSGRSGFITSLYTVFVPIFGALIFRKRTNLHMWAGAVLALIGLLLILGGGMNTADKALFTVPLGKFGVFTLGVGDVYLLVSALGFTFQILLIDSFSSRMYPIRFSAVQFFTAGVVGTVMAILKKEPISAGMLSESLIPILYCGVMSSGVAYTLQVIGQKKANPTVAAIVMSTESMFAAIGGALLLHQTLTKPAAVGCCIIFSGIVLSQIPVKQKKKKRSFPKGA